MKSLIGDNFLLENNTALTLYNEYAKDLPIVESTITVTSNLKRSLKILIMRTSPSSGSAVTIINGVS